MPKPSIKKKSTRKRSKAKPSGAVSKKKTDAGKKNQVEKPVEEVKVAKEVEIPKKKSEKLERKPGSSNSGEYTNVSPANFAGRSGGASPYSFPINTIKRARNALARAHFAPSPEGICREVYKKWPELDPKSKKKKG